MSFHASLAILFLIVNFGGCSSFTKFLRTGSLSRKLLASGSSKYRSSPIFSESSPNNRLDDGYAISQVGLWDMYDIIRLANDQFLTSTDTIVDILKLDVEILKLFLPKLLFPKMMRHSVIGVRSATNDRLVAFVDLSLQMSTGSLDALKPKTIAEREKLHGKTLAPYLCNLFVSPGLRKRGLARKLISACEAEARRWGCNTINLHVEMSSRPALSLYLSSDFNIVMTAANDVVFMSKKL